MTNWDYSAFWNEAMSQLKAKLGEHEFGLWFNISYESATEGTITVGVPSTFYRDQLVKNYQRVIESMLLDLSGKRLTLDFVVVRREVQLPDAVPDFMDEATNSPPETVRQAPPPRTELDRGKHPQLRLDFVFENFVIGENNSFAANAALAIASNPGTAYNPFLIYGGVGLGKTHLMQSIGNRVWRTKETARIICITAEEFTNEFIQSIHDKTAQAFKNKYRYVDVLLIDDIHFFQDKKGVQEELFYTFNALYDAGKQMVFTCDRPVSELKNLNDRLRSRFERGLNVDLQPPNFETRMAILRKKTEAWSFKVPVEAVEIIAKNISSNVRDLEAALGKLVAYAQLVGKEITLDVARQQLKDVFSQPRQGNVTVDTIIRTVSDQFKVSYNDLKGKKRTRNIAFPRQVAMYIAREITEFSTTELGLEFGGRDHTTVMHACQKVDEKLKLDPSLEATIQKLIGAVKELSTRS
ncbi:MAG: chromosomal replication initiator protein DnaA [Spirochaetales bacterium]|nr:chromosomal replication initiator protein DnaA [Spirochaetales bacterium]